jgi:hypothetical protein
MELLSEGLDRKPILSKKGNPLTERQLKNWIKRRRKLLKRSFGGAMPAYRTYINSDQWRKRCEEFYRTYGRFCAACGSKRDLCVHHMAYTHMGHELDSELVVLCSFHHMEFHKRNGTRRDMIAATTAYIREKQGAVAQGSL